MSTSNILLFAQLKKKCYILFYEHFWKKNLIFSCVEFLFIIEVSEYTHIRKN